MRRLLLLASIAAVVGCGDNGGGGSPDLATGGGEDLAVAGGDDLAGTGGDLAGAVDGGSNVDAFMCTPNAAISCGNGMGTVCNANGDGTTTAACVTLKAGGNISMCADATSCQQCVGANVCGAGANANTSYGCSGGMLGTGTACQFGCDPSSGLCRDMHPSNQGGDVSHLAGGDTFTCTGTQDATLAAVSASTGDTLTFDTTAMTIKVVNGATTTDYTAHSKWGASYKPTGSGTNAIVAHVKSVSAMNGAKVVVTGANALILLVDGDVTLSGTSTATTLVDLSGSIAGGGGPGAPSTNGAGGSASTIGGGGAGHGTAGAHGGADGAGLAGAAAGAAYGAAAILEAGAGGADGANVAGVGHNSAGGALQISACGNLSVDAHVTINASGGGGNAGKVGGTLGGSGGASGGTLLLEASTFNVGATNATVAGKLAANGGGAGGGGGIMNDGMPGSGWDPTMPVTTAAAGGGSLAGNAGTGGNGGVAGTAPVVGGDAKANANGGGGGGGAVGLIFLNRAPSATAPTASAASPAPVIGCVATAGSAVTCP